MKAPAVVVASCLLFALCAVPSAARSIWTLSGNAGISFGNQTDASLTWWGAVHRQGTQVVGVGLEAGRQPWDGRLGQSDLGHADSGYWPFFAGLASGPHRLEHLSVSLRLRGPGRDSRPNLTFGVGPYRQVVLSSSGRPDTGDWRNGLVRLGGSMAFGGAGTFGIKPGAEFRLDLVDTVPGPSAYFTAALGVHLNR